MAEALNIDMCSVIFQYLDGFDLAHLQGSSHLWRKQILQLVAIENTQRLYFSQQQAFDEPWVKRFHVLQQSRAIHESLQWMTLLAHSCLFLVKGKRMNNQFHCGPVDNPCFQIACLDLNGYALLNIERFYHIKAAGSVDNQKEGDEEDEEEEEVSCVVELSFPRQAVTDASSSSWKSVLAKSTVNNATLHAHCSFLPLPMDIFCSDILPRAQALTDPSNITIAALEAPFLYKTALTRLLRILSPLLSKMQASAVIWERAPNKVSFHLRGSGWTLRDTSALLYQLLQDSLLAPHIFWEHPCDSRRLYIHRQLCIDTMTLDKTKPHWLENIWDVHRDSLMEARHKSDYWWDHVWEPARRIYFERALENGTPECATLQLCGRHEFDLQHFPISSLQTIKKIEVGTKRGANIMTAAGASVATFSTTTTISADINTASCERACKIARTYDTVDVTDRSDQQCSSMACTTQDTSFVHDVSEILQHIMATLNFFAKKLNRTYIRYVCRGSGMIIVLNSVIENDRRYLYISSIELEQLGSAQCHDDSVKFISSFFVSFFEHLFTTPALYLLWKKCIVYTHAVIMIDKALRVFRRSHVAREHLKFVRASENHHTIKFRQHSNKYKVDIDRSFCTGDHIFPLRWNVGGEVCSTDLNAIDVREHAVDEYAESESDNDSI